APSKGMSSGPRRAILQARASMIGQSAPQSHPLRCARAADRSEGSAMLGMPMTVPAGPAEASLDATAQLELVHVQYDRSTTERLAARLDQSARVVDKGPHAP
ncbi:MAG: hypothetical protein ACKPKO_58430, partial [Candidatus Fonsibacter sp.]